MDFAAVNFIHAWSSWTKLYRFKGGEPKEALVCGPGNVSGDGVALENASLGCLKGGHLRKA